MEAVQWLRAQGVEWDKHTCRAAIKHVHVLKWLREERCGWGDMKQAYWRDATIEVRQYVRENHPSMQRWGGSMYKY